MTTAAPAVEADTAAKLQSTIAAGFALLGGQLLALADGTFAIAVGGTVRALPDLHAAQQLLAQLQGVR